MKIYTKVGDKGKTFLPGEGFVPKDDLRIEALGALDELNSTIGVTLCFVEDEKLRNLLSKIQNDLFTVGADLAGSGLPADNLPRVSEAHVEELEGFIDELEEKLGQPTKFILPGGTASSSFLHLCRATTRRTERVIVNISKNHKFNESVFKYLNRLGDLFFILARSANKELDVKEQQPMYKYFGEKKVSENIVNDKNNESK